MYNPDAVWNLGRVGLFLGIESHDWPLANFMTIADFCALHKIDYVLVKVFDGPNEWYNGNFPSILAVFNQKNVACVPYGFLYGNNAGSSLLSEIALTKKYMALCGYCCMDMEQSYWVNRPAYGLYVHEQLISAPGVALASIPANPVDANQIASFAPMNGVISMWMPMAYSDYLCDVWPLQIGAINQGQPMPMAPTYDLSSEFGANNVLANATHDVMVNKIRQFTLWEWGFASQNPHLVDQLVSLVKPMNQPNQNTVKRAQDTWNAVVQTPYGSGLATSWRNNFFNGLNFGPPLRGEYSSVDDNGKPIQVLECKYATGWWYLDSDAHHWYNMAGLIIGQVA